MSFSLVICTFERRDPLLRLLTALEQQTLYPDEILIVDASFKRDSKQAVIERNFRNLHYHFVDEQHRGLTKQRNYGISKVADTIDFVCFFDDDIVPENDYFEKLIATYDSHPSALGVGGYIIDNVDWEVVNTNTDKSAKFVFDGWQRSDSSRFILRKRLRLDSDRPPGFSTGFSHGRSVGFLPPSRKTYEVEQLMGGVSSFRKSVFDRHSFSTYFNGYGLYEDADFCLRLAKTGKLYLNTAAKVYHYHASTGRPNQYKYGKMVVRNGYYVWRVKNPKPNFKDKLKWHAITLLLALIRLSNVISDGRPAFTESIGRISGWFSIGFNPPRVMQDPAELP